MKPFKCLAKHTALQLTSVIQAPNALMAACVLPWSSELIVRYVTVLSLFGDKEIEAWMQPRLQDSGKVLSCDLFNSTCLIPQPNPQDREVNASWIPKGLSMVSSLMVLPRSPAGRYYERGGWHPLAHLKLERAHMLAIKEKLPGRT